MCPSVTDGKGRETKLYERSGCVLVIWSSENDEKRVGCIRVAIEDGIRNCSIQEATYPIIAVGAMTLPAPPIYVTHAFTFVEAHSNQFYWMNVESGIILCEIPSGEIIAQDGYSLSLSLF